MLDKPQTKLPDYMCDGFSDQMQMEFEEFTKNMSESDVKDLIDIINIAYKEGYTDGWKMHTFFTDLHPED